MQLKGYVKTTLIHSLHLHSLHMSSKWIPSCYMLLFGRPKHYRSQSSDSSSPGIGIRSQDSGSAQCGAREDQSHSREDQSQNRANNFPKRQFLKSDVVIGFHMLEFLQPANKSRLFNNNIISKSLQQK